MKQWLKYFRLAFLSLFAVGILAGCDDGSGFGGSPDAAQTLSYQLVSVDQHGNDLSKVYEAVGETVPQVAQDITSQSAPQQVSKQSNTQMFVVYPNQLYNIQQDPNNTNNTIVEVDNTAFVQDNYQPSFLDGYIAASLMDHLFWTSTYYHTHTTIVIHSHIYRGYSTVSKYHTSYGSFSKPTKSQFSSFGSSMTVHSTGTITRRSGSSSWTSGSKSSYSGSNKWGQAPPTKSGTGTVTRRSSSSSSSWWGSSSSSRSSWGSSSSRSSWSSSRSSSSKH